MKCRWIVFLGISLTAIPTQGDEDIDLLGSSDFAEREKAQITVHDRIANHPTDARDEILKFYLATTDPEQRIRLLPILERAYFPPKGFLGILMDPTRANLLRQGRVPQDRMEKGIRVMRVYPGTPAEESGLRQGDVIVKMNDWIVEGGADLNDLFAMRIQEHPPSVVIRLEVKRGEEAFGLDLKLGILPVPSERARVALQENANAGPFPNRAVPLTVQAELDGFRFWLSNEIEKDTKSHR